MKQQIDWRPFIPLVKSVFRDNKITGGCPHTDKLIVVRSMLLQAWYGLSDPELEFQCYDRLSFKNFLGFPDRNPDFTTIWKIRDRLKESGVDTMIWDELQRQLNIKGYRVKKGVIQDASFIEAGLGKKRYQREKKARRQGEPEFDKKQQFSPQITPVEKVWARQHPGVQQEEKSEIVWRFLLNLFDEIGSFFTKTLLSFFYFF